MSQDLDTTRLTLLLNELRLPAVKQVWPRFAERCDKEGWPAARFLMSLAEHEIAERDRRRIERHLAEAKLLAGKTLESFDFAAVPMISKAQVLALCEGDGWLRNGANLLLIGPPGGGKSHLSSAIGLALLEKGYRVMFARTSTSCSVCRWHGANCPWKRRSIASIASSCSYWMILPTSPRIRPRPPCCSS